MALITCKECKKEISSQAEKCPQCGAPAAEKRGLASWFVIVLVGIIALNAIFGSSKESEKKSAEAKALAEMTPEQKDAKQRTDAAVAKINAAKDKAMKSVIVVAMSVKAALRNPKSVEWLYLGTNIDATLICVEYRAQNGFGGLNREHVVAMKGLAIRSTAAWNKHCADKLLTDVTCAIRSIPLE